MDVGTMVSWTTRSPATSGPPRRPAVPSPQVVGTLLAKNSSGGDPDGPLSITWIGEGPRCSTFVVASKTISARRSPSLQDT